MVINQIGTGSKNNCWYTNSIPAVYNKRFIHYKAGPSDKLVYKPIWLQIYSVQTLVIVLTNQILAIINQQ